MKDIRKNEKIFGGLTVLLSGDWRQILPIVPRGSRSQIINCCLKNSYIWDSIEVFTLAENMRVSLNGSSEAKEFADFLLSVSDGSKTDEAGYINLETSFFSVKDS